VAAKIRDFIIDHNLKPGDRLPTEGELAERFAVSRVSIREATKALQFLGIIDAAPRRGLSVGKVSMKRLSRYLGFHFAIADYPVDELIDTRLVVESGGLEHAAARIRQDPSIYEKLCGLNQQLAEAATLEDWINGDRAFHCELVAASGLRALAAFNDLVQVFFRRFRENFPQSEWPSGVRSHQRIIDLLREGDVAGARSVLEEHIASHRGRTRPDASVKLPKIPE
jgi:DNA-binding FadR family transcriptional regulator